jgi:PAS domain S-box-containing protein
MRQAPIKVCGMGSEVERPPHAECFSPTRAYPRIVLVLVIAIAYWITGRLSLLLAIPPGYATAIWPASGIALAGVLVCGYGVWPGIVLGSFLVNIWTCFNAANGPTMLTSAALATSIGLGAALQALLGAFLVRRYVGFPNALDRDWDISLFLALGGPVSCLVNATIGVGTLVVEDLVPRTIALSNWCTWWIGDSIGVLVATPLILIWTAEPRQLWRRRRLSVAVPLVVALAFTVGFFTYTETQERDRLRLTFGQRAATLAHTIEENFDNYLDILRAIQSFYDSSHRVERHEFHTFVQASLTHRPGIQALAWVPRMLESERVAYEEIARQEGYPSFQLTEQGPQGQMVRAAQRSEYFPVYYVEPYVGNEASLGFDLASNPARRDTLYRARDTGEPMATQRLTLVQETGHQFGFLICMPLYSNGRLPPTMAMRHQNLSGFAVAIFRLDDMLEATLHGVDRQGMELWIIDELAPDGDRLLYGFPRDVQTEAGATFDAVPKKSLSEVHWSTTLELAGHYWTLHFAPTLTYLATQQTWQPWAVRLGCLLLTGLLGAFLLVITSRTTQVERLVAERTAELQHANTWLQTEISERRRIEEALSEREARTRAILETAIDGIVTIDEQGTIESFNPAAERLFGYAATEVMGQSIGMLMPLPYGEEHGDYLARYRHTGERRVIGIRREVLGQRKDGTTFCMELDVSEVRLEGRRLFTGIVRDITERRHAEAELARTNAELRSSNQELEQFAYVASHDLKAPLRGIAHLTTWIEEDLTGVIESDLRDKMGLLRGRVRRLEALLDDLLEYSRVGRVAETVKAVDTRAVVTDITTLLAPPEGFTVTVAETLPTFDTAEKPLRQVFMNLLSNAIKHHDRPDGHIEVAVRDQGEYYEFLVTDDGPGILPMFQTRIFQMFQTLKSRDEVEGSGMGLALVKKVVEGQGGLIRVESDATRRGTTMRFTWRKQWQGKQA